MNEDFSPPALEEARKFFAGPCDFMMGAANLAQLPEASRPEIAFAGRSNVGKSTLINALTGRGALAKTSNTPGRTQQLNYFDLGSRLYLVDMPGYGYARVSKKDREAWRKLIRAYLRGRTTLRQVMVLIDARHGLKDQDEDLMALLDDTAVSYRIILTKADKVKNMELAQRIQLIETALKSHPAAYPFLSVTSARKSGGLPELRAVIASFAS